MNEDGGRSAGDLQGKVIITPAKDNWAFEPSAVTVTITETNGNGNNEISWSFTTVSYKFVESWSDFKYPEGITADSSGSIYVADTQYNRIQKFAPVE